MAPTKPVKEIRLGRIRAAIWGNQAKGNEVWFSVTISRLYKDGDQWKDSSALRRDDLPIAARVLDMAYAWIWEQPASANPDEAAE
jgi:hypothetical protein